MANRAQRRKQKKNNSKNLGNVGNIGNFGSILDTKKLDRLTNDKMIWAAMSLIGIAVGLVVVFTVIIALTH